jgi:hypothetical protein
MGDFPMMTEHGTFIINGTERVIVTQLVRSPGAYLMEPKDPTKQVFIANLMPSRGSWLELEIDKKGVVYGPHRPEAQAPDHDPAPCASRAGPVDGRGDRHVDEREDPRAVQQLDLHREHAREGHDDP